MIQRFNTNKRQIRKCHSKNLSQIRKVQINLKNPSEEAQETREISNLRKIIREQIRYQFQEFNPNFGHKTQQIDNIKIQLAKFKNEFNQKYAVQNTAIKETIYKSEKQNIDKKLNQSNGITFQSINLTRKQGLANRTKELEDQNIRHKQLINNILQSIRQLEKKNQIQIEKLAKKLVFVNQSYTNTVKKLSEHIEAKFNIYNKQIMKLKGNKQNIKLKRNASQNFSRNFSKEKYSNHQQVQNNNQNLYHIDEQGFLLDEKDQYILNEKQQPIKLNQQQIEALKTSQYIRTE